MPDDGSFLCSTSYDRFNKIDDVIWEHAGIHMRMKDMSLGLSIMYRLFGDHKWKDMGGVDGALRELVGNIGNTILEMFDAESSTQKSE